MIGDRLKERITAAREKLRAELVAQGTDEATAAEAVGAIGDGQILAWLLAHKGDILAVLVKLLPLLLA